MAHHLDVAKEKRKVEALRLIYLRSFPKEESLSDCALVRSSVEYAMGFLSACISEAGTIRRWVQILADLPAADRPSGGR